MDNAVRDRVTQWEQTSFDEDLRGLSSLVSSGFSGAIESDSTWWWIANGMVVTPNQSSPAALAGDGVVYTAPDPGLPLLFAMFEADEQLERGFTDKESYDAVHERLVDRSFCGYLKLSEYVLSGEYYVVYHGNQSFPLAYIGSHERLHTGDSAFSKAVNEVGIFEVYQADIGVEPIEHLNSALEAPNQSVTLTD